MEQELKEYIQSLIPEDFPDGNQLVEEGRKMAGDIPWNKSRFLRETGYKSHLDYRKENLKNGKQTYQLLVGLSTLEEEIEAIKKIDEFHKRTGFEVRSMQSIPSQLVGLDPKDWEGAPKPTSYLMEKEEDWLAHTEAAPVDCCWQDWHLASPNNLNETKYALKAGTSRLGCFSTFIWEYPGYNEEKKRFSDMFRTMGILSAKKDEGLDCITYPEDGLPGFFMDVVSYVGYEMIEHYIIEDLCGARMALSYGGLLSEIVPRMSFALAMEKLYGTPEHPFVTYYNGSTNEQWDHDIESNYGLGASEMLIEAVINLKYGLPTVINPVSITEALRVPTLDELFNIVKCGIGIERKAKEWLDIIDFTRFEEMRDLLIEKGTMFYENVMKGFEEAGVNIKDPLEMVMVLRRFDPVKFEQEFHPSLQESEKFKPYVPTVLGRETMEMTENVVNDLKDKGYESMLKGKKVICGSADGHSYGLMLIDNVWSEMNADVVDCGTNMEPSFILDLYDEEDADAVCVSVHCGQTLDYARQLKEEEKKRGKKYNIVIGGMLNAMLPGNTEPVDVSDIVEEMGICATNDFEKQINFIGRD
ncbi:MAG TPA: cobalamin-dependent protein [Candidatus Copromorpha excrementigallinarum]|uniref:Cobalamin-dependent protein n=1 Tax=Candidatus Allocopromorpha excrementigallinarum TaxID=2840742 RepID=A0A9D1HZP5_9FIRM|nr:cobalamin-dependent protein [Candidatus Copromorpha excrementigallinarum]